MFVIHRVGQMLKVFHKCLDVLLIGKILDQFLICTLFHIVRHDHVAAGANHHKAKPANVATLVFNNKKRLIFATTEIKTASEGGKYPFFRNSGTPQIFTAKLHAVFPRWRRAL